jgi:hypothetical protein
MVIVALAACQEELAITSSFGDGIVSGQVSLGGDLAGGSPEGMQASIPGTGMELVLRADGRFLFSGVPDDAEIFFSRSADGISASYQLGRIDGALYLEVSSHGVRRSRGRPVTARATQLEGLILEVDDTSISVNAAGKGNTVAVINDETVIRKGNELLTPADLSVGDRVHIVAQPEGETFIAKSITLQMDADGSEERGRQETELEGLILAASGTEIEIDAAGRGPVTVAIGPETLIRKGNRLMTPDQLEEGWRVHVKASSVEGVLTARLIIVQNMNGNGGGEGGEGSPEVQLEGTIVSISADAIVVDAAGVGETEAAIDGDTVIRKGNMRLEASDLREGDRVHVKAIRDGESLIAREIRLQNPG